MADTYFARLKPQGHKVRRYSYDGVRFTIDGGWKRITAALARELSVLTENKMNPSTPLIFDVKSGDEAAAIDTRERKKEGPARPEATAPIVLSRSDAPSRSELPIDGYESMSARKIGFALSKGGLSQEDLLSLMAFERANSDRRTVIRELEKYIKTDESDESEDDSGW